MPNSFSDTLRGRVPYFHTLLPLLAKRMGLAFALVWLERKDGRGRRSNLHDQIRDGWRDGLMERRDGHFATHIKRKQAQDETEHNHKNLLLLRLKARKFESSERVFSQTCS